MTPPVEVSTVRKLTPRQRQIVDLIGRGKSYDEIARILSQEEGVSLSHHTVRAHVRAINNIIDVVDDGTSLDDNAMTPRERIHLLVKYEQWLSMRQGNEGGRMPPDGHLPPGTS